MPESAGDSPAKVLVVGLDSSERKLLTEFLSKEGHLVETAADGEQALSLIDKGAPDCVVSEARLSVVDSTELCRRLKAAEATRLLPVILLSAADGDAQRRADWLDAGADDVVPRPLALVEVGARIRSFLRLRRLTHALETAQNVVFALATAIEHKDDYTEGHGERVAIYARSLAEHAGLSDGEVHAVYTGGILHDIGKIGCPDAILNKPGPLTPEEFEIIKRHPVDGWEICRHLRSLGDRCLHCIRNHHEKLDGSGYPDGLARAEVPRTVRVMSIADVFDALATARAYKPAFPTETCFKILREESERGWWDGDLVEAFIEMMRQRELDRPAARAKLEPIVQRQNGATHFCRTCNTPVTPLTGPEPRCPRCKKPVDLRSQP
jgi:putative two-component system response regulator